MTKHDHTTDDIIEQASKPVHKKHAHKKAPGKKARKSKVPAIIIFLVLVAGVYGLIKYTSSDAGTAKNHTTEFGVTEIDFYVMSQCPYGVQVENSIYPLVAEFGPALDLNIEFIAQDNGDGTFRSLHGQPEVDGNIIQLCAKKYYPTDYHDFIFCQNKNPRDLKSSIDKCASDNGMDPVKLKACADGEEGKQLHSESVKKAMAVGASGSPTIFVNDVSYNQARDTAAFKRAICKQIPGHPVCEAMPACASDADCATTEKGKIGFCENPGKSDAKCTTKDDAKVNLVIVTSKDCNDCDTSQIMSIFTQIFPAMTFKSVDAASEDGKKLVSKFNLQYAPAFVFDDAVAKTYAWTSNPQLAPNFDKKEDYFVVKDSATGAKFILDPTKRAELDKKVGVVKGDNKPQIDFYVMSYCPYGNQAEEGIEPVYQLLKDKADFNVHFVIYSNYGGGGPNYCLDKENKYCSMHGIQELNQGIREACVSKYMGVGKMFEFMLAMNKKCNYQNADTCWTDVAKGLSLDTAKIAKCEKDEGLQIVKDDAELNGILGVRGSPTVFVDGAAYNGPRAPAGYAQALCAAFETPPSECKDLSSLGPAPTAAPAAADGGCGV